VSDQLRLRLVVLLVIPVWVLAFTIGIDGAADAEPVVRLAAPLTPLDSGQQNYRATCVA
jgi:hypothetical protein